ncbi:l-ascorbate oxidase [Ophiostoma piceae UAMH 11346]|uniref:L-ascorbate oxidase n=1 Tax=Ophiostoma piceae (strain UAMH 11346) TaxID=1262450 RepID=S3BW84_OPHP1|nr:l-ascorbate oxidase [Ophiostoma piceae UAMH 11346]
MAHYSDGTRLEDGLGERGSIDSDAAGQGQRLLGDDETRRENVRVARRFASRKKKPEPCWRSSFFYLAALACFLTLLLLVKIALFDGAPAAAAAAQATPEDTPVEAAPVDPTPPAPSPPAASAPAEMPETEHAAGPETGDTFRRSDSDYVLDANWDYNAAPTVRKYNWVVQNIDANPDGVFRPMTVINGKFPGELIRCNEGDTIVVNVENTAINATSIHWHGLFQNGTNHMDGTPGATQCPIAPGRSFRYEFKVQGQTGTYFYHGHQGAESLDGMIGPIVIHARGEKNDDSVSSSLQKLPYDTDRVVMVQDWYHDLSSELLFQAFEPGAESSPLPNGALINGANIADCSLHPDRHCDNSTARVPSFDLPPGGKHRLRLINVGAFAWIEVSLDRHHELAVTEVDGVDIAPASEKSVLLAPGQRYSVVVSANDTTAADQAYWLRARIATHCFAEYTLAAEDNPVALAVVRYTNDTLDESRMPVTENDSGAPTVVCRDMNVRVDDAETSALSKARYAPVPAQPAPEVADHSYYFRLNLEIHDWRLQRGYFNESSYRPNITSPVLQRVVAGLHAQDAAYSVTGFNDAAFSRTTELVLAHQDVQVIDLLFQNFDEGSHPLHLHGHQMYVLGAGHGYFPGYEALGLKPDGRGLADGVALAQSVLGNPVRRDVVAAEGFGWTLMRVVVDNPGVWKFHCHMIWHGDGGMGMLLLSRTAALRDYVIPAANLALCDASADELEKGAAPKDDIWAHL